jgi:hypothetical protein
MDMREVIMLYGRLAVFTRHDSAEIWGFMYGFKFGIATLKIMASTGVLVRVVCALKRFIIGFSLAPSKILTI